jgi:hypothetical protein
VLVARGALVEPGDIIARTELVPGNPYIVDLCRELSVKNEEVRSCMLKNEGDSVKTGEVIARHQSRSDLREIRAQADGVIEFISVAYGRVLIREEVKPNQPLVTIDVAKALGISAWQIRWFMRVKEEDEVRMGTTLASESAGSFAGLVHSPVSGIVEKICGRTGTVTIRRPYRPTLVNAYIPGKVVEIIPSLGAVIEGAGNVFEGVFGIGGEAIGPLRVAVAGDGTLDESSVRDDDSGKILLGGALASLPALRKAISAGVKAVVTGGVDIETLESLGVGVRGFTGTETLGLTVVVMHGFGPQPLSNGLVSVAEGFAGTASATGATQMRAGVRHPELLLCSSEMLSALPPPAKEDDATLPRLAVGALVRVLMGPHQGKPGKVVEIGRGSRRLPSEEEAAIAAVELDDGLIAEVPVANLKVIA